MAPPELTWRPPQPSVVGKVSPSLLATWKTCRLRVGFQLDPAASGLKRRGLRAAVGIVAHAVLERQFSSQEEFAAAWAAESSRAYEELARDWAPATPPAAQNWPAWALTKHQVAQRVVRDGAVGATAASRSRGSASGRRKQRPVAEPTGRTPMLPWRERWLEDAVLGLKGRPDLVEREGGVLTVADFKTGQGDMTDDHRDQLLIYAALVRSSLGELPARAEIRRPDGSTQAFGVRNEDVDDVARRASSARVLLNDAAVGRRRLEAAPGPDSCPSCPFRVACRPFLQAYQPDWICGHVAAGRVVGTGLLGAQRYLDLDVVAPRWRPRQLRLVGLPQQTAAPGQLWAVSDFEGTSATGFARWNTLTWRWPQ
ncbi:PD-(D/E)XK nuclease family protein [Micromonospora aurantiaca (nom. illeg.)]|uniref:PD-(D/E)XK nuclease family protein n=1 Tax=Micromonospora aurantiaca (nom. illeg.) TaxID=47850 RepID=UPI0033E34010